MFGCIRVIFGVKFIWYLDFEGFVLFIVLYKSGGSFILFDMFFFDFLLLWCVWGKYRDILVCFS